MTDWSAGRESASRRASSSSATAAIDALELRQEDEGVGPERVELRLGKQVGRDRAGARPLSRCVMRASCDQRPTMTLLVLAGGVSRSACSASSAATGNAPRSASESRCVVEHGGDLAVRCGLREREVTGAEERVVDDLRETCVNTEPLVAEVLVEDRREQWMSEADRPIRALDHVRGDCRLERVCWDAGPLQERFRRGA